MFAVEHGQEALQKKHMTAEEAARAAKAAKVLHTVLVHISPRYSVRDEEILRDEAARVHEAVEIGKALSVYPVRLPD
jgi:ribonuclease Z